MGYPDRRARQYPRRQAVWVDGLEAWRRRNASCRSRCRSVGGGRTGRSLPGRRRGVSGSLYFSRVVCGCRLTRGSKTK